MTISSSLNAGVAGLNANASRLATISDNIANSATYGYKRAVTDFHSMVNGSSSAIYSAGGVRTTNLRLIDERGPLIGTSNATDLAIDGRGFMAVTTIGAVESGSGSYPVSLMSTGSFRLDANGVLRTDTGEVLMGWAANADGTMPNYARDSLSGLVPVQIAMNQFSANPTTAMTLGVNLPATATTAGATGDPYVLTVDYYGNLGTAETLTYTFTPTVPATGSSNSWTLTIADSASAGATVGEYTVTFDDTQGSGGQILSVTPVGTSPAYDAATGTVPIAVAGGTITVTLGTPGEAGGLTQLSDTYSPTGVTKNGSAVGLFSSIEVDEAGRLYTIDDQGVARLAYQIPVVDVPNLNGLKATSNQTYQLTQAAGAFYLWDAGDGPIGAMASYAREESATDVAHELTQLITTQRAYSSNAKVIQTVDEMLQETTNIKR